MWHAASDGVGHMAMVGLVVLEEVLRQCTLVDIMEAGDMAAVASGLALLEALSEES